jgi:hypothetical protein
MVFEKNAEVIFPQISPITADVLAKISAVIGEICGRY